MVHDPVGHDLRTIAQCSDIVPGPKPRIDRAMVDGIEARIGAVDGREKGNK